MASSSTAFSKKRAVLDGRRDASELLVDDAARTHVEMPDLGVAHLPLGQTDGASRCTELSCRILGEQSVEIGRVGHRDRVVRTGLGDAEAVHDDEAGGQVLGLGRCRPASWRRPVRSRGLASRASGLHDPGERLGIERRAAHERSVDIGLAEEHARVLRLDRTAVQHAQRSARLPGRTSRRRSRGSSARCRWRSQAWECVRSRSPRWARRR